MTEATTKRRLLILTPWKRRWELGERAGLADDHFFIDAFTRNGYDCHFVCPHDGAPPDVATDGYVIHAFPDFFKTTSAWPTKLRRLIWPPLLTLLLVMRAVSAARRARPDVILGQTYLTSAAAWFLGKLWRRPTAIKLYGVEDLSRFDLSRARYLRRNLEPLVSLRFPHDAWIVLDDGTGGRNAVERAGVAPERIELIPNGINTEWGARPPDRHWLRTQLGIDVNADVVLFLSRLVDWKRPDAVIRAAHVVLQSASRPTVFVLGGDGPERDRCERLALSLGIADRVCFAGAIPHDRVPDAFAAASVFVATNSRSNMSIPTCEAMVCGVPVVAYDTGETSRVVRDGETGLLVPDGDTDALAAAITRLLENPAERQQMVESARRFAQKTFVDWPARTRMELELVDRLIDRSQT